MRRLFSALPVLRCRREEHGCFRWLRLRYPGQSPAGTDFTRAGQELSIRSARAARSPPFPLVFYFNPETRLNLLLTYMEANPTPACSFSWKLTRSSNRISNSLSGRAVTVVYVVRHRGEDLPPSQRWASPYNRAIPSTRNVARSHASPVTIARIYEWLAHVRYIPIHTRSPFIQLAAVENFESPPVSIQIVPLLAENSFEIPESKIRAAGRSCVWRGLSLRKPGA